MSDIIHGKIFNDNIGGTAGDIGGSGTANYIPLFSGSTTILGNSFLSQSGTSIILPNANNFISSDGKGYIDMGASKSGTVYLDNTGGDGTATFMNLGLSVAALGSIGGGFATGGGSASISDTVKVLFYTPLCQFGTSQVSFGGAIPGSFTLVDFNSTTKTIVLPRMTTTQKNALTPLEGMITYDTTLHKLSVYTGSVWETITSA